MTDRWANTRLLSVMLKHCKVCGVDGFTDYDRRGRPIPCRARQPKERAEGEGRSNLWRVKPPRPHGNLRAHVVKLKSGEFCGNFRGAISPSTYGRGVEGTF